MTGQVARPTSAGALGREAVRAGSDSQQGAGNGAPGNGVGRNPARLSEDELRAALVFCGKTFEAIENESHDAGAVLLATNAARCIRALLED